MSDIDNNWVESENVNPTEHGYYWVRRPDGKVNMCYLSEYEDCYKKR